MKNTIIRPNRRFSFNHTMGTDVSSMTNTHIWANHCIGANHNICI